ncbi:alpha/beta hydrolase [Rhodobacteraceae bacterium NNCM2]|nr:alpha/beta hydrolase [Coraliihabitans acroporae]
MTPHWIQGGGGITLHVRECGPVDAPAIVLIHGWSQHHMAWMKQTTGPLTEEFRVIAPDLRGHGASDKPLDQEAYTDGRLWAEDIRAICHVLELEKPVLVGWSYGVQVLCDYLRTFGDDAIAGMNFVGGSIRSGAEQPESGEVRIKPAATGVQMMSDDQATALAGTVAFLRACTAAPLSKKDLAIMTGYNMLCPVEIRRHMLARDEDYRPDLNRVRRPCLITYGEAEKVCPPEHALEAKSAIGHAEISAYPGAGHCPFWEKPERFNAELADFARRAQGAMG